VKIDMGRVLPKKVSTNICVGVRRNSVCASTSLRSDGGKKGGVEERRGEIRKKTGLEGQTNSGGVTQKKKQIPIPQTKRDRHAWLVRGTSSERASRTKLERSSREKEGGGSMGRSTREKTANFRQTAHRTTQGMRVRNSTYGGARRRGGGGEEERSSADPLGLPSMQEGERETSRSGSLPLGD